MSTKPWTEQEIRDLWELTEGGTRPLTRQLYREFLGMGYSRTFEATRARLKRLKMEMQEGTPKATREVSPRWTDEELRDLWALTEEGNLKAAKDIYKAFRALGHDRSYDAFHCQLKRLKALKDFELPFEMTRETEERLNRQLVIVIKENEKLRRELENIRAIDSLFVQHLESLLPRLPPMPRYPRPKVKQDKRPQIAVLDISDAHLGQCELPADLGSPGLGGYDWDTAMTRMDELRDRVCSIINERRAAGIPIKSLIINFLGDIVTNESIYQGQARDIDRILADQVIEGSYEMSKRVLVPLASFVEKVTVHAVWGNHGRLGKPGTYHMRSNADYLFYHNLRILLQANENIEFRLSLVPFMGYELRLENGAVHRHLLAHGDQIRRYYRTPYYGLETFTAKMVQLSGVFWDVVHIGHHHKAAKIEVAHGNLLVNGSWMGASKFSIAQLQEASRPTQNLIFLHPEHGLTALYPIYLGPKPSLTPSEEGLYTLVWEPKD